MSTFNVQPNSNIVVLEQDNGIIPAMTPDHKVVNIGRAEILAETVYGTKFSWIDVVNRALLKPGETAIINNFGRPYYVVGLKLTNNTDMRAIVSASFAATYSISRDLVLYYNVDYNNILKQIVVSSTKFIPKVGPVLSALISFFWPDSKPNLFEQIREQIERLLDERILETINALLSGDIRQYGARIKHVEDDAKNSTDLKGVGVQFMNIAQDLIGFEHKFYFGKEHSDYMRINLHLFPLLSSVISMKLNFYHIGVKESQKYGLTPENVAELKRMKTKLITADDGIKNYVNKFYKDQVDYTYNNVQPNFIFNTMMNVRNIITVYGLENLPLWDNLLKDNPSENVYVDVISYSEYFGRKTGHLDSQAIPVVMLPPLTPSLVNNKRVKITKIDVYMWRLYGGSSIQGPPKIGGMNIIFEDGKNYTLGTVSKEINTIEFKGADLLKLTVIGTYALDVLTFNFSDGREISIGTKDSNQVHIFEFAKHKIASIFVSSDSRELSGQAANVTVSYQMLS